MGESPSLPPPASDWAAALGPPPPASAAPFGRLPVPIMAAPTLPPPVGAAEYARPQQEEPVVSSVPPRAARRPAMALGGASLLPVRGGRAARSETPPQQQPAPVVKEGAEAEAIEPQPLPPARRRR